MNEQKTCKTCKFWESSCGTIGNCEEIGEWKGKAQIVVSVADDHNLSTRFSTLSGFGCNIHQLKIPKLPLDNPR